MFQQDPYQITEKQMNKLYIHERIRHCFFLQNSTHTVLVKFEAILESICPRHYTTELLLNEVLNIAATPTRLYMWVRF